ncbi:MAG: MarC family protein [Betaproteobacteria bacterium]|nr:MAG: MarC family protein [Betaproteobacteria bacterium]
MLNDQVLLQSFTLFFALLNPFLLSIYLLDLISDLDTRTFYRVLVRASLISGSVFWLFAWGGEAIFTQYLQVRFASFQLFGGVIFLLIGVRFVFSGVDAIRSTRGAPEHLAGSIAMPFLIGPGTVSAAVVIGSRHGAPLSGLVIFGTLALTMTLVVALKVAHDYVKERNARLIDRYMEVVGRISALLIGTIAIEMIMVGGGSWLRTITAQQ